MSVGGRFDMGEFMQMFAPLFGDAGSGVYYTQGESARGWG